MNIKAGTDIIEIERIKEAIEKHDRIFLETVFTEKEIEYCEKHKNQKYQHYAARFAAKEATFKALSFYYTECKWKDYEVINDSKGKPVLNIKGDVPNLLSIDVSLSHCKTMAVANVTALIG